MSLRHPIGCGAVLRLLYWAVLALPAAALAQEAPVSLSGTIRDQASGAPVVNARLTVLDGTTDDTLASNVFTDARGHYETTVHTAVGTDDPSIPSRYWVGGVAPNPVPAGEITIRYATPGNRPEAPALELYDLLGRRVDRAGSLGSGVYFYRVRFEEGHVSEAQSLLLVGGGPVRWALEQVEALPGRAAGGSGPAAKAAGGARDVRLVVEKPGFQLLEATRSLTEGENELDFTLERAEGAGKARLILAVKETTGAVLPGVQVEVVDDVLGGTTNSAGEVALDSVYTGIPVVLRLTKPGYMEQFVRTEVPAGFGRLSVGGIMRPRAAALTLAGVEGGADATGMDGAKVELPADALVDVDGNPVTGSVALSMTPLDVTDDAQLAAFPGAFEGFDPEGTQQSLATLGVTEFVLEQNGQELDLAEGKTAVVELPLYVETDERGNPLREGDTVPLWSLDEGTGIWVHETDAVVVASAASPTGLALRGEVSHFSLYNCDIAQKLYVLGIETPVTELVCMAYGGTWNESNQVCGVSRSVCLKVDGELPEAYGPRQTAVGLYCSRQHISSPSPAAAATLDLHRTETGDIPDFGSGFNTGSVATLGSVNGLRVTTLAPADVDLTLTLETAPTTLPGREGLFIGRWTGTVNGAPDETKDLNVDFTFEPLDTGGDNEEITVPAELSRAIDPPGSVDTYRFDGTGGDFMLLDVCRLPGSALEGTALLRVTGGLALDLQPFGEACANIRATLPETGSYTIEVDGTAGEPGGYSLSLRKIQGIEPDTLYQGTIDTPGVRDIYSFTLEEEQLLVIAAEVTQASDLGFFVYLVDAEGTLLVDQLVLENAPEAIPVHLAPGTYTLQMVPRNTGTGAYNLILLSIEERTAELGTTYEGTIDRPYAFDRYRLTVNEPTTLVVQSSPDVGVFGMITRLVDAEGNELGRVVANVPREFSVAVESGTYFIELDPQRDGTGTYSFTATAE